MKGRRVSRIEDTVMTVAGRARRESRETAKGRACLNEEEKEGEDVVREGKARRVRWWRQRRTRVGW